MDERLFALPEPDGDEGLDEVADPLSSAAFGRIAEHLAVAELLRRGFRVAVPVVDDDGVDLIVDYRLKVQIKATDTFVRHDRKSPYYRWSLSKSSNQAGGRWVARYQAPESVDVWLLYGVPTAQWWVVPAWALAEIGVRSYVGISPGGRGRLEQWQDAWHVFKEERL